MGFQSTMTRSWEGFDHNAPLQVRLQECRFSMSKWKSRNQTNAAVHIKQLYEKLDYAMSTRSYTTLETRQIKSGLSEGYREEEEY